MTFNSVSLPTAMCSSPLPLYTTVSLMSRPQGYSVSGKKINYNPGNSQATDLISYANRLADVQDSIDQVLGAIETALTAIEAISVIVDEMKILAAQAKSTPDMTDRSNLAAQFDKLQAQIIRLAENASYQGTNLISQTADSLTVTFDENATHTLTIAGRALNRVSVGTTVNNWQVDGDIEMAMPSLDGAATTMRSSAQILGSNARVLAVRRDFTRELFDTLEGCLSKPLNTEVSKEAADLLALQIRQQLGTTSLSPSLVPQWENSVLSLF